MAEVTPPTEESRRLAAIDERIENNFDQHLHAIRELIRQPSISAEGRGIRECAELLADRLRAMNFNRVEIVPTRGHPVVYGEYWCGAPATLLIYHMYDVQPADEEGWTVEPFAAEVRELAPFGRCIVARGAKNSKGPLGAWLNAAGEMIAAGASPVNLLVVIEGEEELGSRHLPDFVAEYQAELARADSMWFPYAMQDQDGRAIIWPGTKGLLYLSLEIDGASWGRGPQVYGIHSSSKPLVDNPASRLIQALATLFSEDGNRPTVDGFFDRVRRPSASELARVERLAQDFSFGPLQEAWQVKQLIGSDEGVQAQLERYFFEPTLNVDGLLAGYTGPGSKTLLPHRAMAKIDCRLVPDQDPDEILDCIRRHLDRRGFHEVQITVEGKGLWSQTDPDAGIVLAVEEGCLSFIDDCEVWPRNVGFFPGYVFNRPPLNLPFCVGGIGHGARAHSPDEYFVIDGNERVAGLIEMEKAFVRIMYAFARRHAGNNGREAR